MAGPGSVFGSGVKAVMILRRGSGGLPIPSPPDRPKGVLVTTSYLETKRPQRIYAGPGRIFIARLGPISGSTGDHIRVRALWVGC